MMTCANYLKLPPYSSKVIVLFSLHALLASFLLDSVELGVLLFFHRRDDIITI